MHDAGPRVVAVPDARALASARSVVDATLVPTPLLRAEVLGDGVSVKAECLQVTGSFKVRGGLAAIAHVAATAPGSSVVTCSAGNHGLGLAYASSVLQVPATVVVPETASPAKVAKLRGLGATLIERGADYPAAERYALELASATGAIFVSPYNDTSVIAGQATLTAELAAQLPSLNQVVVPVGGGGLASGMVLGFAGTAVTTIGVQAAANAAMAATLAGASHGFVDGHTVADGLAGGIEDGSVTVEVLREAEVQVVTVSEQAIAEAVAEIFTTLGLVVEPSGAVGWAAVRSGHIQTVPGTVVVLTGRNVTASLFADLLERAANPSS